MPHFPDEESYMDALDSGLLEEAQNTVDHFGMKVEDMATAKSFGYEDSFDYEIDFHVGASLPYDWDRDNLSSPTG